MAVRSRFVNRVYHMCFHWYIWFWFQFRCHFNIGCCPSSFRLHVLCIERRERICLNTPMACVAVAAFIVITFDQAISFSFRDSVLVYIRIAHFLLSHLFCCCFCCYSRAWCLHSIENNWTKIRFRAPFHHSMLCVCRTSKVKRFVTAKVIRNYSFY